MYAVWWHCERRLRDTGTVTQFADKQIIARESNDFSKLKKTVWHSSEEEQIDEV